METTTANKPNNQPNHQSIAVGIVSKNEADDLDRCLATVPWATEIYVLNMGSTDHTVEVAEKYGAIVIDVRTEPVAERVRNAYLERYQSKWLLQLDCDERLHPDFITKVQPILQAAVDTDVAAYALPFRLFALNTPLDHGMGTNPSVRLFRHGRVRYNDQQEAHQNPILDGSLLSLVGQVPPIDHYAIRSIDAYREKCERYARTEAESITSRDQLDPLVTMREFYRWAIVQQGWRDGFPGIAMAMMYSFSRGLGHLYAWERMGGGPVPIRFRGRDVTRSQDFSRMLDEIESSVIFDPVLTRLTVSDNREIVDELRNVGTLRPQLVTRPSTWRTVAYIAKVRLLQLRKR